MKTCQECVNIGIDATVPFLERSKDFERRGMKDIYPEDAAKQDAEDYENDVLHILNVRLAGSGTGRALLTAILATRPKIMLIRPMDQIEKDSSWNVWIKTPQATAWDPSGRDVIPTRGYTANSLIKYSAEALDRSDQAPPGMRDDEVLLHEMVHGLRDMKGAHSITPMGGSYDSVEEFMAIFVSNIYSSEVGRPLRGGHRGAISLRGKVYSMPLDPSLEDPKHFLAHQNFRELVGQFISEHPTLSSQLIDVWKARFNPIRELVIGERK